MKVLEIKNNLLAELSETTRIIIAAVFVGIMAGFATFLLKKSISYLSILLTGHFSSYHSNYLFLVCPLAGILLATLFQLFIHKNLAHGTEQLKNKINANDFHMRRDITVSPLLGCIMTVGMGGSAGSESPSAYAGAAIGDRTARWFQLSPASARILFGCGAAAGIAGIFKSPVGGIMFAVEVLQMEFTVIGILAVTCAAITAFSMCFILSGFSWDLTLTADSVFDPSLLWWIALFGIFCGIYSAYYDFTQKKTGKFFLNIRNRWLRAGLSGLGIGVAIFIFPSLYGEGYNVVSDVINGARTPVLTYSPLYQYSMNPIILISGVAAILLIKGVVVGATNNGGGVAGKFAPTIFAGCLCGYLFAFIANSLFDAGLSTQNFALIGCAAVMAGAVRAPLMAVFIAAEISDHYNFIIAFIIVSALSYLTADSIRKLSVRFNKQ